MNWWEEKYGNGDCLLVDGVPCDWINDMSLDFIYSELGLKPGTRVLDTGCGGGRITIGLAKKGALVTGIDLSRYQLDRARRAAEGISGVTLLEQDYHTMTFKEGFDAVISWSHSLGYGTREDDREAVRRMVEALVPDGKILIDMHNLARYRTNHPGKRWEEQDTAFVLTDNRFDETEQKFVFRDIIIPKDGGISREYTGSHLEYQPAEIKALLESVGVRRIEFYGDACAGPGKPLFSREGYGENSAVMIAIGVKSG